MWHDKFVAVGEHTNFDEKKTKSTKKANKKDSDKIKELSTIKNTLPNIINCKWLRNYQDNTQKDPRNQHEYTRRKKSLRHNTPREAHKLAGTIPEYFQIRK